MKLFIATTIVMLSLVTVLPEASAICASADPEINGPIVRVWTQPTIGFDIDPNAVDPNAQVRVHGSCG